MEPVKSLDNEILPDLYMFAPLLKLLDESLGIERMIFNITSNYKITSPEDENLHGVNPSPHTQKCVFDKDSNIISYGGLTENRMVLSLNNSEYGELQKTIEIIMQTKQTISMEEVENIIQTERSIHEESCKVIYDSSFAAAKICSETKLSVVSQTLIDSNILKLTIQY